MSGFCDSLRRVPGSLPSLGLVVIGAMLGLGCESPPPTNLPLLPSSESFVVEDTNTDWEFMQNEFVVSPLSPFQFVEKANREKIAKSLARIDAMPTYSVGKPESVDDADYWWLKKFTERPTELRWLTINDAKSDNAKEAFCLSTNGLLLATVGKKMEIWDATTGSRMSSVDSVVANCKQVFFDAATNCVYLADEKEIVCQRIADGEVTCRWRPAKDSIVNVVKSRDVDVLATVTQSGDLVALDSELKPIAKLQMGTSFNRNIAIRSDGRAITYASQQGASIWNIEAPAQVPVTTTMFGKLASSFEKTVAASGLHSDYWIQGHRAFFLFKGQPTNADAPKADSTDSLTYLLGFDVQFSHCASVDGNGEWLVTIGSRREENGQRTNQILDVSLGEFANSKPHRIERKMITAASFDLTGERVAIRSENGLEIFARERWIDESGVTLRSWMPRLFRSGEFDRLESCAAEIRKLGWRKFRWCGAEHWDDCAMHIAMAWVDLIAENKDPELLRKIEEWANRESDLGLTVTLLCSQCMKVRIHNLRSNEKGQTQLKNVLAYQSSSSLFNSTDDSLRKLLRRDEPTPACYAMALYRCGTKDLLTHGDRLLQQCVERWPTCYFTHRVALELLVDKFGNRSNSCYAYVRQLPQLLPRGHAYSKGLMASVALLSSDTNAIVDVAQFSRSQLNAIAKNIFSDVPLQPWCYEVWFPIGLDVFKEQRTELLNKMIKYHHQHYEMPSKRLYSYLDFSTAYGEYMDKWMQ